MVKRAEKIRSLGSLSAAACAAASASDPPNAASDCSAASSAPAGSTMPAAARAAASGSAAAGVCGRCRCPAAAAATARRRRGAALLLRAAASGAVLLRSGRAQRGRAAVAGSSIAAEASMWVGSLRAQRLGAAAVLDGQCVGHDGVRNLGMIACCAVPMLCLLGGWQAPLLGAPSPPRRLPNIRTWHIHPGRALEGRAASDQTRRNGTPRRRARNAPRQGYVTFLCRLWRPGPACPLPQPALGLPRPPHQRA